MEELTFSETENGLFEVEFTAIADFAIHIEREGPGNMRLQLTSVSGTQYAPVLEFCNGYSTQKVFDVVVLSPVWPLYMKIISSCNPTMCTISYGE